MLKRNRWLDRDFPFSVRNRSDNSINSIIRGWQLLAIVFYRLVSFWLLGKDGWNLAKAQKLRLCLKSSFKSNQWQEFTFGNKIGINPVDNTERGRMLFLLPVRGGFCKGLRISV